MCWGEADRRPIRYFNVGGPFRRGVLGVGGQAASEGPRKEGLLPPVREGARG